MITLSVLLVCAAALAVLVEDTRYGKSSLRLEVRPDPMSFEDVAEIEKLESAFAKCGVQARWISVVDPSGNPHYRSEFLPTSMDRLDEREERLKQWITAIRKQGMSVVSWYPLITNKYGAQARPEWAQKFIMEDHPPGYNRELNCCILSGYGDALINFSNEAIEKFGLDGIWFDGSAWTHIWDRPMSLSCICDSCRKIFKEQTGLELPDKVDWNDPVFRRWVAWRYDTFGAYIARLARDIRQKHPNASVAINHYHRPGLPWQSAVPLNPYDADIIYGSEAAAGGPVCDLTTRLCRAYGRPQSEVFRPLDSGAEPDIALETGIMIHHALTCVTAGGMPSYGTNDTRDVVPPTTRYIAEYLDKVRPYVCARSIPYAALHVSQQTETFYLSRAKKGMDWHTEPYWKSLLGWTQGLMAAHIAPDYVYDNDFVPEKIARYKVLLMPMSFGLTDEQCRTALAFARSGGTLVLGIAAGELDEWGEKCEHNLLGAELGFAFESVPSPAADELEFVTLLDGSGKAVKSFAGLHTPVTLSNGAWKTLHEAKIGGKVVPAAAFREFERGRVMLAAVDFPLLAGEITRIGGGMPVSITDETSASGRHSLICKDRPCGPRAVHPHLEMAFAAIGPPLAAKGRLRCALRLGKGAQVRIEVHKSPPGMGPSLLAGRDGKLMAADKPLCEIPYDTWFRVGMRFRLVGENRTWDVMLDAPGLEARTFENLPYVDPAFDRFDTAIVRGESTEDSEFFVDDIELTAINGAEGSAPILVTREDFESGMRYADASELPALIIANEITALVPPPIRLDGPDHVHMGAFCGENGETIIHLHNIFGSRNRAAASEPMTLRVDGTVESARLVFADKPLSVQTNAGESVIEIPHVSMHEVLVLR